MFLIRLKLDVYLIRLKLDVLIRLKPDRDLQCDFDSFDVNKSA